MAVKMRVPPLSCTVTTSIHSTEMNEAHLELSSSWISSFTDSLCVLSKTTYQSGVGTYAHSFDAVVIRVQCSLLHVALLVHVDGTRSGRWHKQLLPSLSNYF
ncbi:hypothetical protein QQG55_32430 [Brugia pahangi]